MCHSGKWVGKLSTQGYKVSIFLNEVGCDGDRSRVGAQVIEGWLHAMELARCEISLVALFLVCGIRVGASLI